MRLSVDNSVYVRLLTLTVLDADKVSANPFYVVFIENDGRSLTSDDADQVSHCHFLLCTSFRTRAMTLEKIGNTFNRFIFNANSFVLCCSWINICKMLVTCTSRIA